MALGWDLRGGDSSEFQATTCALLSTRKLRIGQRFSGLRKTKSKSNYCMRLHAERGQCLKPKPSYIVVAKKVRQFGPPGCHFPHQREILF